MDLLRLITDMQIASARYANPLSGLPGNVPISEYIKNAIEQKENSVLCYIDLDNFKPYNDIYGYEKGDKVIVDTAKTLMAIAATDVDFVGHVGGDDFIIIFRSENWHERCNDLQSRFVDLHLRFYNQQHLEQQGIEAQDRQGNNRFFPLLSMSIGVVKLADFPEIRTDSELAEKATKAKSIAKKTQGNSLYVLQATDCE